MHTARIPPVDPAPATITAVLAMHAGHICPPELLSSLPPHPVRIFSACCTRRGGETRAGSVAPVVGDRSSQWYTPKNRSTPRCEPLFACSSFMCRHRSCLLLSSSLFVTTLYFFLANVITQFFSQVLPASAEKACSNRAPSALMSE